MLCFLLSHMNFKYFRFVSSQLRFYYVRPSNTQNSKGLAYHTHNYMNFNPHGWREVFKEFHYGKTPKAALEFISFQTDLPTWTDFKLYRSYCERKLSLLISTVKFLARIKLTILMYSQLFCRSNHLTHTRILYV